MLPKLAPEERYRNCCDTNTVGVVGTGNNISRKFCNAESGFGRTERQRWANAVQNGLARAGRRYERRTLMLCLTIDYAPPCSFVPPLSWMKPRWRSIGTINMPGLAPSFYHSRALSHEEVDQLPWYNSCANKPSQIR